MCRDFDIHWDTLTKVLENAEPPGYRQSKVRGKRKIGPFLGIIEDILRQDQRAPRKQRHTKRRIFQRLKDEHGYTGVYTAVKEVVRAWERQHREVFVPLTHPPGEAQVDFGQARIIDDGQESTVAMFVMTLPYSDAIFVCVFPRECTETFQEGHRRALEFFGGVPHRISYDNTKIAISRIVGRRKRELTQEFLRLQSHFLFEHHFCLVRRPNEKGHVENLLGYARRNFLVPIPETDAIEALNVRLEEDCRRDLEHTIRGKVGTKAQRLAVEACGRGKRVRFWRVTELITQLMEAREERALSRMKSQLAKLDLLVLDEFGYVPASKLGAEPLFDVISIAYERTSIIVTTNLPFEQWAEILGSERLTGATLDRLTHRCHIIESNGESYRLKDAKRRRRGGSSASDRTSQ